MLKFVGYKLFFKGNQREHSLSSNCIIFSAASSVKQLVVAIPLCKVLFMEP